ncbi:MAG: response regulator transcription factor [Candidatus Acidiferrales bacterium]
MNLLRILIVDDNDMVRCGLKMLLEQHEGWAVCGQAVDGRDAIDKAVELKPDMILLDITMPRLDGLSALPLLREKVPASKILILTVHHSLDLARIAANKGASGFISKSLVWRDLVPEIEALENAQAS